MTAVESKPEMEAFVYEPLKDPLSFRLLKVEPERDGLFCCTLEEEILPSDYQPAVAPPTYTALSYTWGDHNDIVDIICNGKLMRVTNKLCEALRGIAPVNKNDYIWADQICINQQDVEEKQQQVSRMTKVYELAITVLAWLGPERRDTGLAVDWIQRIASLTTGFGNDIFRDYENNEEREKVETMETLTVAQSEELGLSFENSDAWRAFSTFYDSPWYERAWVVQELLPAREAMLVCGSYAIDWHAVKAAAAWYLYKAGAVRKTLDPTRTVDGIHMAHDMNLAWNLRYGGEFIGELMHQTVRPTYKWLLPRLLHTFFCRKAADPRDKFFALLGISEVHNSRKSDFLAVDYSKSVRNVYRDMIRGYLLEAMTSTDELNILWTALPRSGEPGWPSWVPDLRRKDIPGGYSVTLPDDYPSEWRTKFVLHETTDLDCLALEGKIMGRVIFRSEWDCGAHIYQHMRSEYRKVVDFYRETFGRETYCPDDESLEDLGVAFAMSLSAGQMWPGFREGGNSEETYAEFLPDLAETIYLPRETAFDKDFREVALQPFYERGFCWDKGSDDWQKWTFGKYCGRRLFVTDTGYIGIAKREVQVGDAIAVIWGLSRSCLLKPLEGDDQEYEFLGEAYCRHADKAIARLPRVEEWRPEGEVIRLR